MANQQFSMSDYVGVPERLAELRVKHPEASLQPVVPEKPFDIVTIGDSTFVVYAAACYRTPDDPRPGIGLAWERVPGRTPYTRDSELQNAETSAWGRAIVAVGAADAKRGVASADEIRNRQDDPPSPPTPSRIAPDELHHLAPSVIAKELAARGLEPGGTVDAMRDRLRDALKAESETRVKSVGADAGSGLSHRGSSDGSEPADQPHLPVTA
jgi:hypothetical protein